MKMNRRHQTINIIFQPFLYIFWSLSLLAVCGIVAAKKPFHQTVESQTLHNLMNAFSRTLWGLAVAWIIVACHNGYGGELTVTALFTQLSHRSKGLMMYACRYHVFVVLQGVLFSLKIN